MSIYKQKYLKYKTKYLELSKTQMDIQSGSGIESLKLILDLNNLELISELSSGWNGTIYKVKNANNNKEYILKLEKLDEYDENNNLTSEYYRQVDFDERISSVNPDKFMILKNHGIVLNCDYEHPKRDEVIEKANYTRKQRFLRKNSQTKCYYLLYKPILDGTFNDVKNIIKQNELELCQFILQIVSSINIYRKEGFIHTDFSPDNIMYKLNDNKYQWYIIDYGNITNNTYPDSLLDLERLEQNPYYKTLLVGDLLNLIEKFGLDDKINKIKSDKNFNKKIKKDVNFNHIKSYIPDSIYDMTDGDNYIQWYIKIITKILYPEKYIEYNSDEQNQIENLVIMSDFTKSFLLECISHSADDNYDELLEKLSNNIDRFGTSTNLSGGYNYSEIYVFNKLTNIIEPIYYSKYDEKIHTYVDDDMLKKISKNNFKKICKIIKSEPNYKKKFFHVSIRPFEYPILDKNKDNSSWLGGNLYKNPKGIWISCGLAWQNYIGDDPNNWSLSSYIYTIEPTNTVLHINSIEQLEKFINDYKKPNIKLTDVIDWKKVKKNYDGMIICPYLGNKIWGTKANKFGIWGDKLKINEYFDKITKNNTKSNLYFIAEWVRHWEEATGVIWKPSTGLKSIKLIKKNEINIKKLLI